MKLKRISISILLATALIILLTGCNILASHQADNTSPTVQNTRDNEVNTPWEIEPADNSAPYSGGNAVEAGESAGEPMLNPSIQAEKGDTMGSGFPMEGHPMPTTSPIDPPQIIPYNEDEEPKDMFFDNYQVNPFIDTEDDNLSTFATDVDTGAYTIARSYINQGLLPPEDSVRIEEYINFFPQGYALPSARDTFKIQMDGAPSPFTETDRYDVIRIGIQGYDIPRSDRKDAALTFVIDVSGSMGNGNRLEMVQDSLMLLVDQLNASDTVGIVAYTDTAWVVLPPTSARHVDEIEEAIYSLYPMASTNAEAGLILGYREANKAYIANGINRVVLCSDGVANVGNTGPDSIWESIADYASEGINLTSVGVGMGNYDDVLMEQLADQGNGFYAYVDSFDEAKRLFVYDLVSTLQVIALDAKVQVEFNPEVVSRYRLIGFENRSIADEDFRNNQVDAAEIGAGHAVTALYEVKLYSGERGEIATVHLRWQDPDTFRVEEISQTFDTRDLESSFHRADPYFQLDVLVAEFGEILRDSYWAEGNSLRDLLPYAEDLIDQLENQEVVEFVQLLENASRVP